MTRYVSLNESWDEIQEQLTLSAYEKYGNINIQKEYGNTNIFFFNTNYGITYSNSLVNFNEDIILEGKYAENMNFLCFNTGDSVKMLPKKYKESLNFTKNTFWNGRCENYRILGEYYKNKKYITHSLAIQEETIEKLIPERIRLKKPVFKNENFSINVNKFISSKQKAILENLSNANMYQGKLKEIYLESKILDLVFTSIEELESQKEFKEFFLSSQDILSLKRAKEILLSDIKNPPSLKSLAYKSAINEFKLKKGFKQIYGNTVYGLLQEHRLIEAKKLLESGDINISEASLLVGYKSIGYFSNIFKKRFGISPIEIKKESKKFYI